MFKRIILCMVVAALLVLALAVPGFARHGEGHTPRGGGGGGGSECFAVYQPTSGTFLVTQETPSGDIRWWTTDRPPQKCNVETGPI